MNVYICQECSNACNLVSYTRNKDCFAFRCMTIGCCARKKYKSIREKSIFERYRFCLKTGLKLLWKWTLSQANVDISQENDVL
ncbi:hypothetical protein GVAV_001979 [Gurleya vavrai]